MNTNKEKKLNWFKFYPADIADFLELPTKESAKRFKLFLTRLLSNKAPEGTVEAKMIADSMAFIERQRSNGMKRWNRGEEMPEESAPQSSAYAGRNGLVRLTDDEYSELLQAVGNKREADRLIDSLDNSLAEGKRYRNRHVNVLLYWNDYRQDKAREAQELAKVNAEARAEANRKNGYKSAAERMDEMVKGAKHLIALNSLPEVNDG